MRKTGKWVNFILVKEGDKTNVWIVSTKQTQENLGEIRWYSKWRRYAFLPYNNTVYENICLHDIANFIGWQMRARKESRK